MQETHTQENFNLAVLAGLSAHSLPREECRSEEHTSELQSPS